MEFEKDNIKIRFTAPDLIEIEVQKDTDLAESHMRLITDFSKQIEDKAPFIYLYRVTEGTMISKSAREYMATTEANKNRKGAVVIVQNTAQKILGQGFIKINQPPVPMLMVKSEKEAFDKIEDLRQAK